MSRLQQLAEASCVRLNKVQCQVLCLGHNGPVNGPGFRKGGQRLPSGKGLEGSGRELSEYEPAVGLYSQEDPEGRPKMML